MIAEETVENEDLAAEAAAAEAPLAEPTKRTRKAKAEKAPKEPKPPKEPKAPRVKIDWKPADGPYPVQRGRMLTVKIKVLRTDHNFKGKMGSFINTILASETAMEALGVPAMVKKGEEEVAEFMDPGYITFAVRSGLIELVD
jgi:hypothetical protein